MSDLRTILGDGTVMSLLQPIVRLSDRAVVGYEALARGPEDSPLHLPDALFDRARAEGLLGALDAACIRAALAAGRALSPATTLFVNVEPETYEGPEETHGLGCSVIIEVTERALALRPAELLLALERARRAGWGVAIDDVGVDWRSLALMPFLRPDVIKLDRGIVATSRTPEAVRVIRGVRAHIERDGGLLLAEGIETETHERRASGLGAELGQGWFYGRPAREARPASAPVPTVPARHSAPIDNRTPFAVVRDLGLPTRIAVKNDLVPLTSDLEREAMSMRDPAVILSTFQDDTKFTPRTRRRYAELARGAAFVAAFGVGLSPEPAPGVRGARLIDGEDLHEEWVVVIVGPHTALAFIARDLGDDVRDGDRRFEYVLTEDRDLVLQVGRTLMLRVAAAPPDPRDSQTAYTLPTPTHRVVA